MPSALDARASAPSIGIALLMPELCTRSRRRITNRKAVSVKLWSSIPRIRMVSETTAQADCEYIVVGSGAGGGTVAARLAEAGHTVILLEAGGDPRQLHGGDPVQPEVNRLPYDYDVPVFTPSPPRTKRCDGTSSCATIAMSRCSAAIRNMWPTTTASRVDGILYPRAGTLGGCTAHNAMILVYPHDADWDNIATLTGDARGTPATCGNISSDWKTVTTGFPIAGFPGWALIPRVMASADGCTPKKPSP